MPRLAWFTPLPPTRSGIAAYNAELLPQLAKRYDIHVFSEPGGAAAPAGFPPVFRAHDFVWQHAKASFDLVVYQLGNAACHDFIWPHLARYPGLVVLHDGQIHHERSRALLTRGRVEDYRAEFRYCHPGAPGPLPDLVVSRLAGSLYYVYPMLRWVLQTARLVAVHSSGLAADLRQDYPGVEVHRLRMGVEDPLEGQPTASAAARVRERHQLPAGCVVCAAFGLVTPEKRISAVLHALARLAADPGRDGPPPRLLLVGGKADYYDAAAEARSLGIEDLVLVTGYVDDEALAEYLAAADVCLCLRWPTNRETSAMWIRAIAAGKPTVITDLAHTADIPALDPATWEARTVPFGESQGLGSRAVAVGIDVLDEEEQLLRAMRRLASDAALRHDLGSAARDYWRAHHTMACEVEDYGRVIDRALERPRPRPRGLPAHLQQDHAALGRDIVQAFGAKVEFLD